MEPTRPVVLVIDGNRVSRKVNLKLMEQHCGADSRILEIDQGEDGLFVAQSQPVSLILMDYQLADMNCITFLEKLQNKQGGDLVPVIVLAAESDESHGVATIRSGARDFLVKGKYSQEHLCSAIDRALDEARLKKRVAREIANREEAEANVNLFRDLVNQTVDILFIADPATGMLLDFNDAAWRNLCYTESQLKQVTVRDFLVGFAKPSAWNDLLDNARRYDHWTHEGEIQRQDGSTYPVEVTIRYITRGASQYMVGVARDITTRKKIEAQLRDLSNRDGLTGIYNRRYLDERLAEEWNRARRTKQPISLIMLDVDFFKMYNDTYGHLAGDQCLKTIAQMLATHFRRAADLVARYGGEEFTVVLMDTELEEAQEMAEAFRAAIVAKGIEHKSSQVHDSVTISLGLSCMVPNSKANQQTLLERADQALYQAKSAGRNQLAVATPA